MGTLKSSRNCAVALSLALLCACAATPPRPCPAPDRPPQELLVPPPAPGAMSDQLEEILRKGQTSAPS